MSTNAWYRRAISATAASRGIFWVRQPTSGSQKSVRPTANPMKPWTLVLCMVLQVPDAHLAVWVAVRVVTEEAGETLLFGVVALLALTIGLAMSLVLLTVAMDQAWLRSRTSPFSATSASVWR
jgi:hypothetical protein